MLLLASSSDVGPAPSEKSGLSKTGRGDGRIWDVISHRDHWIAPFLKGCDLQLVYHPAGTTVSQLSRHPFEAGGLDPAGRRILIGSWCPPCTECSGVYLQLPSPAAALRILGIRMYQLYAPRASYGCHSARGAQSRCEERKEVSDLVSRIGNPGTHLVHAILMASLLCWSEGGSRQTGALDFGHSPFECDCRAWV